MDRKLVIIACFFSILTFISSVVCSSLIFYNEKNRTEINSEKVLAANNIYKTSSIIYNNGNSINFANIAPGYSTSRSFSITNNNSNTIKYKVEWQNIVSTWGNEINGVSHPEELIYSLNCSNGERVNSKQVPTNDKDNLIIDNIEVKTNSTDSCTITINYKNNGGDQSYNENRSFGGLFKVSVIE